MAEIWGRRKVEEISGSRGFHLGVPREQSCSRCYTGQTDLRGRRQTLTELDSTGKMILKVFQRVAFPKHLCGTIEAFLQHDANAPEWRHHLPTGSQLAGSGHTMTLALNLHVVKDGLEAQDKWVSGFTDNKNLTAGCALPTFRPASLLWRFRSGRPADKPLARSGSSTNVWEKATP